MNNNYDIGIRNDFDTMTNELGRELLIFSKDYVLTFESQESEQTSNDQAKREILFAQELDSTHEAVTSGVFSVGDLHFTAKSDSSVEEEGIIKDGETEYKIITLTKVRGQTNNVVMMIKGFAKKLPNR